MIEDQANFDETSPDVRDGRKYRSFRIVPDDRTRQKFNADQRRTNAAFIN